MVLTGCPDWFDHYSLVLRKISDFAIQWGCDDEYTQSSLGSSSRASCRQMRKNEAQTGILRLLRAVVDKRSDLNLNRFTATTVHQAIDKGLGPLLLYTTKDNPESPTSIFHPFVQSADLTARVLIHEQLDGLQELLETLGASSRCVTLLKGISICTSHYPEPQLRLMGDIDLLVIDEHSRNAAENTLRDLGYCQKSSYPAEFYRTLHHSMPFFHPRRNIWIEIHKGLFPPTATVACHKKLYSIEQIIEQTVPRRFRNIECMQLSPELQLLYTCSHWAEEFNPIRGILPIIDVLLLLTNVDKEMNWDLILPWIPQTNASSHLYLMLSYLQRYNLISLPNEVDKKIRASSTNLNVVGQIILWQLIDSFLIHGQPSGKILTQANVGIIWKSLLSQGSAIGNLMSIPWNLGLPPGDSRRFSPGFQLRRIRSALGLKH